MTNAAEVAKAEQSEPANHDEGRVFAVLRASGFSSDGAYTVIRGIRAMAGQDIVAAIRAVGAEIGAKLDAQKAETAGQFEVQEAQFEALSNKMDAQNVEMTAKFDAHKVEMAAKLDAHKVEMAAKLDAQKAETTAKLDAMRETVSEQGKLFAVIRWMIIALIAAVGLLISVLGALAGLGIYKQFFDTLTPAAPVVAASPTIEVAEPAAAGTDGTAVTLDPSR